MNTEYSLKFHPKATKEYIDAVDWYNERQIGLGDSFFDVVLTKSKEISTNPFLYPLRYNGQK